MNAVARFQGFDFHDSLVTSIRVDIPGGVVEFELSHAVLLAEDEDSLAATYSPALLRFDGVMELQFSDHSYALNSIVVECSAIETNDGTCLFRLGLTGGYSNENYYREIVVAASDFSVSPRQ